MNLEKEVIVVVESPCDPCGGKKEEHVTVTLY